MLWESYEVDILTGVPREGICGIEPPCHLNGNSVIFTGSSDSATALYCHLNVGQGDQAAIAGPGSVIGCALPCRGWPWIRLFSAEAVLKGREGDS